MHAHSPLQKSQSARILRPGGQEVKSPSKESKSPSRDDFVARFRRPFRSQSERALSQSHDISESTKLGALKGRSSGLRASADCTAEMHAGDPQDDGTVIQASNRRRYRSQTEEWAAIRKRYGASPSARMFVITGQFSGIRDALLERGWVEHHEYESTCFDLKWTVKTNQIDFERLQPHQIVNHYAKNQHVTTKVGLSKSLRNLQWFEEVDRDTFFPRSYDLNDASDVISFVEDFMMLAAQNALEEGLETLEFKHGGIEQDGMNRFLLALIACEAYIKHCSGGDLSDEEDAEPLPEDDQVRVCRLASSDWSVILDEPCPAYWSMRLVGREEGEGDGGPKRSVSDLVTMLGSLRGVKGGAETATGSEAAPQQDQASAEGSGGEVATTDPEEASAALSGEGAGDDVAVASSLEEEQGVVLRLRARASDALRGVRGMSAQSSLNGRANVWIVKPAGKSRGRGIEVKRRLGEVLGFVTDGSRHNQERWVVQKYLEDPLLIGGRKFDIRQWVLVSDWNPLSVWFYRHCYLRFALAPFGLDALGDSLVHLCNNCVQREGPDFEQRKAESMWDLDQFQAWLDGQGEGRRWEESILPQLKRVAVWAVMSAQDSLVNRKGSCELFGYDLMLDSDYNVWLIEVNSSPDMAATTAVTERLCRQCLYDVVRVLVDNNDARPRAQRKPNAPDTAATSPAGQQQAQAQQTADSVAEGGQEEQAEDKRAGEGGELTVPWDTGGWQLIHQGEVEASVPVSVSGKLRVEGTSMRIHRPGMREVLSKLGVDGTERRSVLRMSGSHKVWASRTEMLRDINTMAPLTPPHLRQKRKPKTKPRETPPARPDADAAEEGVGLPAVVERMRAWEAQKRDKVQAQLRQRDEEAAAMAARFKPKDVLSRDEAVGFMKRMHRDAMKRMDRIRNHADAVQEGMRKLDRTGSQLERTGSMRRKRLKRGASMKEKRKAVQPVQTSSSSSDSEESSDG